MALLQLVHSLRQPLLGMILSCAWLAPAVAQTQQDCADYERLVALAVHGFPGMEGKKRIDGGDTTVHEPAKPVPGYKSCLLVVKTSLSDGDPALTCDLMESAGVEPIKGTQTPEMMKLWTKTVNSLATGMGKCLGVDVHGPHPYTKAKKGREVFRWVAFVKRPALSTSAYAELTLILDQPEAGARLDDDNRIRAMLDVERYTPRELTATFSKQPPAQVSVADFESFAGLRRGARVEDVLRLFGEPHAISTVEGLPGRYYDYARAGLGFSVKVNPANNQVQGVTLFRPDVSDWLRRWGVKDPKINLLGLHRDKVLALLGKPQSAHSGYHAWEVRADGGRLHLSLYCYDHDQGTCTSMSVGWWPP